MAGKMSCASAATPRTATTATLPKAHAGSRCCRDDVEEDVPLRAQQQQHDRADPQARAKRQHRATTPEKSSRRETCRHLDDGLQDARPTGWRPIITPTGIVQSEASATAMTTRRKVAAVLRSRSSHSPP